MKKNTFPFAKYYNKKYFNTVDLRKLISNKQLYLLKGILAKLKYFKNIDIQNKRILDFGCGLGQNTASLCNIAKVDGYDISFFAQKYCRKYTKINVIKRLKNKSYDIILCSHCLEHIPNPYDVICMLKKKLVDDGILILILPKESHEKVPFVLDADRHLYSWNFRSINNLLMVCGFKIVSNDMFYSWGYTRFVPLSKLGFRFYYFCVSLLGKMTRKGGELRIVAKKSKIST
jgi:SAM-dependent methyltransferase